MDEPTQSKHDCVPFTKEDLERLRDEANNIRNLFAKVSESASIQINSDTHTKEYAMFDPDVRLSDIRAHIDRLMQDYPPRVSLLKYADVRAFVEKLESEGAEEIDWNSNYVALDPSVTYMWDLFDAGSGSLPTIKGFVDADPAGRFPQQAADVEKFDFKFTPVEQPLYLKDQLTQPRSWDGFTPRENDMSESTDNVGSVPAADPAEDHKTPGGQPGDHDGGDTSATETVVETPGGTTVTETSEDS